MVTSGSRLGWLLGQPVMRGATWVIWAVVASACLVLATRTRPLAVEFALVAANLVFVASSVILVSYWRRHAANLEEQIREGASQMARLAAQIRHRDDELAQLRAKIHDIAGDCLIASRRLAVVPRDGLSESARDALSFTEGILSRSRMIIRMRSTPEVDLTTPLPAAIEQLTRRLPVSARVEIPDVPLTQDVRRVVLEAVKEALVNVIQHSGATQVDILGRERPEQLMLTISDNGSGGAAESAVGTGLARVRSQALAIGGDLIIDSAPGMGTRLSLEVPCT